MKYTLLDLVQTVLSSMDGDEVSTILETTESAQVAKVIRTAYYDLINRSRSPELYSIVNLDQTNATTPVIMTVPTEVEQIEWIKYDIETLDNPQPNFQPVLFMPLDLFLMNMHGLNTADNNVSTFTLTTTNPEVDAFTILYLNTKPPSYYTTFDDHTLLFDSIDTSVDTFLTATKTVAYARMQIVWDEEDNFIPDLNEQEFQLLLNESKALAWAELKQAQHMKAEVAAKRGWAELNRSKHSTEFPTLFDRLPYYGRR